MKLALQGRDKRALVALGAALLVYLSASYLILPAYDRISARAETASQKEEELRKYRRVFASKDRYEQLVAQARKSVADAETRLIRGDNQSLASNELQTIVEAAAQKTNIPLSQRSITNARKTDEHFNEITMSLAFEGTLNQLTSFLAELRAAPKFLTVRTLQIAPLQLAQEPPVKGELKKTVKVSLTVAALLAAPRVASK
jgi:Tfp pilus assembly protein PilO